jgi:hypothetical protein
LKSSEKSYEPNSFLTPATILLQMCVPEETAPTKMNISIKIIFDPTTTSMKIPTTSDEDTASLLLSPSVTTQSDALPEQLQQ